MGCTHPRHCTSTHSTPTAGDISHVWSPYGAGQLGADRHQHDPTPGLHIQLVFPLLSRGGCSTDAAGDSHVCITTARRIPHASMARFSNLERQQIDAATGYAEVHNMWWLPSPSRVTTLDFSQGKWTELTAGAAKWGCQARSLPSVGIACVQATNWADDMVSPVATSVHTQAFP